MLGGTQQGFPMRAQATVICPSNVKGTLYGVTHVEIGVRVVKAKLLTTTYKFARKHLPAQLPGRFADLAELVRKAAREHGIEIA